MATRSTEASAYTRAMVGTGEAPSASGSIGSIRYSRIGSVGSMRAVRTGGII
jgi:hypothetical protein